MGTVSLPPQVKSIRVLGLHLVNVLPLHLLRQTFQYEVVHQRLLYRHSLLWRPPYHLLHEVQERRRRTRRVDPFRQRKLRSLRRKLKFFGPFTSVQKVFRRFSQGLLQHLDLFFFASCWKQRGPCEDLIRQASRAPNIDFLIIRLDKDNLRRPVVTGLDVRELLLIDETGRPEVNQLDPAFSFFLENDIFWLDVAVHDLVVMQKQQRLKHLNHDLPCDVKRKSLELLVLNKRINVEIQKFGYNADVVPKLKIALYFYDVLQGF